MKVKYYCHVCSIGKSKRKKMLHSIYGIPDYIYAHCTTNGRKGGALGTTAMRKKGRKKEHDNLRRDVTVILLAIYITLTL